MKVGLYCRVQRSSYPAMIRAEVFPREIHVPLGPIHGLIERGELAGVERSIAWGRLDSPLHNTFRRNKARINMFILMVNFGGRNFGGRKKE